MPAAQFDTLRYVETLTAAGVPEPQAKAGVAALANAFDEWGSGFLATKSGIFDVKGDIAGLRIEIQSVGTELKGEIAGLRTEIADIRSELKLIKWMNVTVVAAIVSYVSKSFF